MSRPNTEHLKFKIGLSGTYWDRKPEFSVLLNDVKLAEGTIIGPSDSVQYVEFEADIAEDQTHCLSIRLENKTDDDVVQSEDKTTILKDMLLNIHSINIDDIDLDQLLWQLSTFVGDDPARPVIKGCVNLGWNGTFKFEFTTPFYLWLLETL